MARYLVTGAAGFIGSHVSALLLEQGHEVVGVDELNDAYDVRLKQWRLDRLASGAPGFQFHHLDIRDRQAMADLFAAQPGDGAPFAGVINLAARAGVRQSVEMPDVYFQTNVLGTLNLLEECRRHAVRKFVLASSSSLYGQDNPVPYREDQNTDHPVSPYAASKKAAEALCYTYHALYGIDTTVFRFFTVYGPAGRPDMAPLRFTQWIAEGRPLVLYGDGTQSRDFTYVDDIARGTVAGLKPVGYAVVNLGGDRPHEIRELISTLEEYLGRKAIVDRRPAHPADVERTWADISRARELLGWSPTVPFAEGLRALVDWYQCNREWASQIRL